MNIFKKTIGTLALVAVLAGGVFAVSPADARATFIDSFFNVVIDGVAGDVSGSSMTLFTSGTEPIQVQITGRTRIVRGPIQSGDQVKVTAKVRNGVVTASVIKVTGEGPSYGTRGDKVVVDKALVVSRTHDSFTVESNGIVSTFRVTNATRFFKRTQAQLKVGDEVQVIGTDTGRGFVAKIVYVKNYRNHWRGDDDDHDDRDDDRGGRGR
jgi:hypothetical protein